MNLKEWLNYIKNLKKEDWEAIEEELHKDSLKGILF